MSGTGGGSGAGHLRDGARKPQGVYGGEMLDRGVVGVCQREGIGQWDRGGVWKDEEEREGGYWEAGTKRNICLSGAGEWWAMGVESLTRRYAGTEGPYWTGTEGWLGGKELQ